ncbi:MAG: phosphotransferase [Gaiellaceae bacterium]|nr:phosphotransferase [Gaiellaceae bacterium]
MRWLDPSWRAEAEEWIRERVDVTGSIEQPHVYPWSTVLRVSTAEGPLWFKATTPAVHGFEPRLTEILAETCPDRVTELVEIDDERAWMLMRDGGTRLRELEPPDFSLWEGILPRYAELQIAVTPSVDELLALGVPDLHPAGIPNAVEELLEDDHALMLGESQELRRDQRDELRRRLPELRALVEELEAFGIPATIQHDDLHDGQVFVRDGHVRILDWGDSCISHPFHTLTVTLRIWRIEPARSAGRSPGTGTSRRPLPASAIPRTPRVFRTAFASISKPGRSGPGSSFPGIAAL